MKYQSMPLTPKLVLHCDLIIIRCKELKPYEQQFEWVILRGAWVFFPSSLALDSPNGWDWSYTSGISVLSFCPGNNIMLLRALTVWFCPFHTHTQRERERERERLNWYLSDWWVCIIQSFSWLQSWKYGTEPLGALSPKFGQKKKGEQLFCR